MPKELAAEKLWTPGKPTEVEISKLCTDELAPKRSCKELWSEVKQSCAPNLNCCANFGWEKFESEENKKIFHLCQDWVGLDNLRVNEYTWTPFSLTITVSDMSEKLDSMFAIFHFAAFAKSREQRRLRFWRLRERSSRGLLANSEAKLLISQVGKYLALLGTVTHNTF